MSPIEALGEASIDELTGFPIKHGGNRFGDPLPWPKSYKKQTALSIDFSRPRLILST
jgi:hypothetical protein